MPANEDTFDEILEHQSFENLKGSLKKFSSHFSDDSQEDDNQVNAMANLIINGTSLSYYQSTPIKAIHEDFFRDSFEVILQHAIFDGTSRKTKVVEWIDPEHLPSIIDLRLSDNGIPHDELLNLIRGVIKYSVKTGNPRFINQLFSSIDPYGLVGQWLTDALNPSVYTYEVSPVFSLMENQVLQEMRSIIGWAKGDGIFCPGGSIANGYAINLARHHKFPKLKESGLAGLPRLVVFTSEDAHYSVKKLAAFLGIGTNNVYCIKVDSIGKMDVNNLEEQIIKTIQEGAIPLMVSATAGTTVLGVFDPIRQISALCQKYDLWLHVDAAWGGGALISKKHKKYLDGIELADSVTWNPHKLLAAPQQCSTLLVRHQNLLQSAHCSNATYLFQKDKFYDTSYDSGDKHVQCGRRADVLKFWLMWKAKGTSGFEKHVDRVFHLSRYFADLIRNREGWKLLQEPECTNVCFWYIPKSKRHLSDEQLDKALHKIAPIVKERMIKKGSMLVTYQPIHGKPNFFRFVLQNSALTEDDMRYFVNEFEVLSEDL